MQGKSGGFFRPNRVSFALQSDPMLFCETVVH